MYNITGQFTTTADFKEGSGNIIPAGSNVYLTVDRYWDVLAGTPVTGVKGAKEVYYRRGNVNITPANIGAVAEDGNISDTTVTFADTTTRANLVSGEKVSAGFRKIKKWFADLKSFAFKDLVNNLTTSTTGNALDASQGKILKDKYDELNQSLAWIALPVNKNFIYNISEAYHEIWISFRIQYAPEAAKPYIARDLYISAGERQGVTRMYTDSYYFDEGNRVTWGIQYDPINREISVLEGWINAYYNGVEFTPDKILRVRVR